jgi:lysophospholipase L1-like esterase
MVFSFRGCACGFLTGVVLLALVPCLQADNTGKAKVRILLLGDSTVIGIVCRHVAPKADHLEDVIRKLLAAEKDLPSAEVINQGRDGEYIQGFLQGRYAKEIAKLPRVDFVLIRYGINDSYRRNDFGKEFPKDYRELIKRLQTDHPKCRIILETIIPYMGSPRDKMVNDLVREVAKTAKLDLLDRRARFAAELKHGPNMLSYRRVGLDKVPEKFHPLLPREALTSRQVVIMDNTLDAHLRDVPGWFGDRHPNLAGYQVIGSEAAKFLAPLIRKVRTEK